MDYYQASTHQYAVTIGLPMKSRISGALLATVPNQGAIACYNPPLDSIGNPVAGLAFIKALSQNLQLSIFSSLDFLRFSQGLPLKYLS